nr:unnamed protein product [Digitaria exilis]
MDIDGVDSSAKVNVRKFAVIGTHKPSVEVISLEPGEALGLLTTGTISVNNALGAPISGCIPENAAFRYRLPIDDDADPVLDSAYDCIVARWRRPPAGSRSRRHSPQGAHHADPEGARRVPLALLRGGYRSATPTKVASSALSNARAASNSARCCESSSAPNSEPPVKVRGIGVGAGTHIPKVKQYAAAIVHNNAKGKAYGHGPISLRVDLVPCRRSKRTRRRSSTPSCSAAISPGSTLTRARVAARLALDAQNVWSAIGDRISVIVQNSALLLLVVACTAGFVLQWRLALVLLGPGRVLVQHGVSDFSPPSVQLAGVVTRMTEKTTGLTEMLDSYNFTSLDHWMVNILS